MRWCKDIISKIAFKCLFCQKCSSKYSMSESVVSSPNLLPLNLNKSWYFANRIKVIKRWNTEIKFIISELKIQHWRGEESGKNFRRKTEREKKCIFLSISFSYPVIDRPSWWQSFSWRFLWQPNILVDMRA